MDQPQEIRDRFVYAVGRSAKRVRPGPWEEELRCEGREGAATRGPVGTFAVQALSYISGRVRSLGSATILRLAHNCRQAIGAGFNTKAKDAREIMRYAEEAKWRWPTLPWQPRKPFELVLESELPGAWFPAAMCMSTRFGVQHRRLRLCSRCKEPFVLPTQQSGLRTCGECRRRPTDRRSYLQGLPTSRRRLWSRLDQRLRQWVQRRVITDFERDRIRDKLLEDPQRQLELDDLHLPVGRGIRERNRTTILTRFGLPPVPIGVAAHKTVAVDAELRWRMSAWWEEMVRL